MCQRGTEVFWRWSLGSMFDQGIGTFVTPPWGVPEESSVVVTWRILLGTKSKAGNFVEFLGDKLQYEIAGIVWIGKSCFKKQRKTSLALKSPTKNQRFLSDSDSRWQQIDIGEAIGMVKTNSSKLHGFFRISRMFFWQVNFQKFTHHSSYLAICSVFV